ncbi:hypothetical protein GCM10009079_21750 [Ralstonia mannitolilytica]
MARNRIRGGKGKVGNALPEAVGMGRSDGVAGIMIAAKLTRPNGRQTGAACANRARQAGRSAPVDHADGVPKMAWAAHLQ